jgi:hypothetical protein
MLSTVTTILVALLTAQQPNFRGEQPSPRTGSPQAFPGLASTQQRPEARPDLPLPPPGGAIAEAMRASGAKPVPPECGEVVRQNSEGLYIVQQKLAEVEAASRETVDTIESAYFELQARHLLGFFALLGFIFAINILFFIKARKIKRDYLSLIELRTMAARKIESLQEEIVKMDPNFPVIPLEIQVHKSLWSRWITWTIPAASMIFIPFYIIFFL